MIDPNVSAHYVGDCRELLKQLPDGCVQTCVTSPPYWGLRDYFDEEDPRHALQIGHEQSPSEYVSVLVDVFREVRRTLCDDGLLWLNIGDSYAGSGKGPSNEASHRGISNVASAPKRWFSVPTGIKPKDLIGIPWMVAFALRADGWYLRSDIIWSKPDAFPSSVNDRVGSAHEYVFMLAKSERYYFDGASIAEPAVSTRRSGNGFKRPENIEVRPDRSRDARGRQVRPDPQGQRIDLRHTASCRRQARRTAHERFGVEVEGAHAEGGEVAMRLVLSKRRLGWYWRLVAKNGRIVAIGGEPFASKSKAQLSFLRLRIAFWRFETQETASLPIVVEPRKGAK